MTSPKGYYHPNTEIESSSKRDGLKVKVLSEGAMGIIVQAAMDKVTSPQPPPQTLESWFKLVSPLLAIATFAWGIWTYNDNARKQAQSGQEEARRTEETRRIEASKPFLQTQLTLFTQATAAAAAIATSNDAVEVEKATAEFKALYWGLLGMVERGKVIKAMVDFKSALDSKAPQTSLQQFSLNLAHACKEELGLAWATDALKQ